MAQRMGRYIIIALAGVLTACSPYGKYHRPAAYAPEDWKNPTADTIQSNLGNWWEVFNDEQLDRLEQMAFAKNYSLEEAFQNWQQARAQAYVTRAAQFPQIFFNPNFYKQESLFFLQGFPTAPGQIPFAPIRIEQAQYTLPLDVSYELDIWHQLLDNYKSSIYNAQAKQEAYNTLILSISADVALHFYTLRGLDSELDVLIENMKIRQEALDVTQSRYDAGLVNFTDVSRAETELSAVKADFENTTRQRNLEENILATLTAEAASDFTLPHMPLNGPPPSIPSGIPCEVLLRRPDIREAERNMASSHLQIAVQYANYFPSLTFQGSGGYLSPLWRNLLDWKARFWYVAGNISQVVFDGGTIQGNVAAAKAVYLQSVAAYQNTVLQAFREVEDALGNIYYEARQEKDLVKAVESAQTTLNLSSQRYTQGLVYYLEVVDAERSLLENQRNLVKVQAQQYTAAVSLIKALGGGWDSAERQQDEVMNTGDCDDAR